MGQTKEREIAILPGRSLTIFAYVCLYTENGRCPYFPKQESKDKTYQKEGHEE